MFGILHFDSERYFSNCNGDHDIHVDLELTTGILLSRPNAPATYPSRLGTWFAKLRKNMDQHPTSVPVR